MPSLQRYTSHGRTYYRIVESYRKEGKPRIRVLAHLGKVEDLLNLFQGKNRSLRLKSRMVGAVCALDHLAKELDIAGHINRVLLDRMEHVQQRDRMSVGETLVAAMIGRACSPTSKRAFADWAETTYLGDLMGFSPERLTSQHFWDQMNVLEESSLSRIEESILCRMVHREQLEIEACAYDTTNFYTYLDSRNHRCELAQRGHNKQKRHDLRQLGLALVVDRHSQLPLFHQLYPGNRNDARCLRELIRPIRTRLRRMQSRPEQLTLIFDAGANSSENLQKLGTHYVAVLRACDQQKWLSQVAERCQPVEVSKGKTILAYRERREVLKAKREVVAVFSPSLYEGQVRGLHQQLDRLTPDLTRLGSWSRYRETTVRQRLTKMLDRQYLRRLIQYELSEDPNGGTQIRIWSDWREYRRLLHSYFGFRVLATDRKDWTTAEIIQAHRSQSRVESSFRDLKDPAMIATHPQFHWTDQKLRVHAFVCVMAYLLVRLLGWRYQKKTGNKISPRSLLAQLKKIRISRVVEVSGKAGRPRLHYQLEEMDQELEKIGKLTQAFPKL
jgi:transposase